MSTYVNGFPVIAIICRKSNSCNDILKMLKLSTYV